MSSSSSGREYWAFISYRHADNKEEGRQWATWLHQAIETYEVPADLVGTRNLRGEKIPERIFPVFRDEEELAADHDLAGPIFRALDSSRYLVVICSPRSVRSPYVANEIAYFKRKKSERVIAMMIDGEPGVESNPSLVASGVEECFPEPLRVKVDAEGALTTELEEPIAADFRIIDENGLPGQGWTSPEALRQDLKHKGIPSSKADKLVEDYTRQLALMKMKVIAGVLGVELGTLTKRDQAYQLVLARKRARILRRWMSALTALALLAMGAGLVAWFMKIEADNNAATAQKNEQTARENYSNNLAANGLASLVEGRTPAGLAQLSASLSEWPDNPVAKQRFLYELLYRKWAVASRVLPAPPAVSAPNPDAVFEQGSTEMRVLDSGRDGEIRIEIRADFVMGESDIRQVVEQASYSPASGTWSVEATPGAPSDEGINTRRKLRNGLEIQGRQVIGELCTHAFYGTYQAVRDGSTVPFRNQFGDVIEPYGFLAANKDHSMILIASFASDCFERDASLDTDREIVLRFFEATTMKEVHYRVYRSDTGTGMVSATWEGPHIILRSLTHGRDAERIDVLEVVREPTFALHAVIEEFIVKDRQWDWHEGALYVLDEGPETSIPALAIHRPMEAAMSKWSAAGYAGGNVADFESQKVDGKALGLQKSYTGENEFSVKSPVGGWFAVSEDGRNIETGGAEREVLNVIQTNVDLERSLAGLGFSQEGDLLVVTGRTQPPFGEDIDWEIFDRATGMQVLPITRLAANSHALMETPDRPTSKWSWEMLPVGWTSDGRSLVLSPEPVGAAPPLVPDLVTTGRTGRGASDSYSVLSPGHFVDLQGHPSCLIHPVVLAEGPVPSWFLELARHLYHTEVQGVSAVVNTELPPEGFVAMVANAQTKPEEEEYLRLANLLVKAVLEGRIPEEKSQ